MKNLKHSRFKSASFVVFAAALLYGANYVITPTLVGERLELSFRPHFDSKFDSDLWGQTGPRTWKPNGPPYGKRYEMVDDLLKSGILIGMDKERLTSILGIPDVTTAEQVKEVSVLYVLGDQRAYPAKSIWFPGLFSNLDTWMLEIRLRDGRIYSAKVFFT